MGNGFEAEEAEPCVLVDPPNDDVNEEGWRLSGPEWECGGSDKGGRRIGGGGGAWGGMCAAEGSALTCPGWVAPAVGGWCDCPWIRTRRLGRIVIGLKWNNSIKIL